ncbi:MAG: MauE/DoxX family redox-associated membrane protein [Streptosporangiaceae bacterium]
MVLAFCEAQLLVLMCVFLLASVGKLVAPWEPRSLMFAGVEAGLCGLLLVSAHSFVRLVTAMVLVAATWVLGDLRTSRPDEGCGCFGVLSSTRIGKRTIIRTGLLAVSAILTFVTHRSGAAVLGEVFGWRGLMFGAELVFFLAISPEPAVLLRRSPVACELRRVPLSESLAMLRGSEVWREYELELDSVEPAEVWRELCWRFYLYPARGAEADAVFAVSLDGREVRASLVDRVPEGPSETGPNPRYVLV